MDINFHPAIVLQMSNNSKVIMAATDAAKAAEDVLVFLRHWMEDEFLNFNNNNPQGRIKESIIRKTTVAYGIVELLARCYADKTLTPLQNNEEKIIRLDNFAVCISRVKGRQKSSSPPPSSLALDDIKGVSMLSSGLSLSIEEPAYLSYLFEEDDVGGRQDKQLGKYLEVELTSKGGNEEITEANTITDLLTAEGGYDNYVTAVEEEEKSRRLCCYLIAKVLYELFTGEAFPEHDMKDEGDNERSHKRVKTDLNDLTNIERAQRLGVPVSICRMMQNLLESGLTPLASDGGSDSPSGDAYKTLKAVGEDLHLLLFDPDRFLFDRDSDVTDCMPFLYKKDKLYGRDTEENLITDTFCRVTRGKSEAFFIGGFSGSGKSMLVNTLRERVKVVGGYVIKHKFDAISQDRPISGVISAVDQLCVMILARHTPHRLAGLVQKIKDEFGADVGLLARMLPSISVLSPDFVPGFTRQIADAQSADTMNARSVCFTLLRFVRIVSNPSHPIMVSHSLYGFNVVLCILSLLCEKEPITHDFNILLSIFDVAVLGRLAVGR